MQTLKGAENIKTLLSFSFIITQREQAMNKIYLPHYDPVTQLFSKF